jgi:hypothetical protein
MLEGRLLVPLLVLLLLLEQQHASALPSSPFLVLMAVEAAVLRRRWDCRWVRPERWVPAAARAASSVQFRQHQGGSKTGQCK